ncbi:Nn.00g009710.m01.CDS01 [Neocucurbitaria sp. VM-36]
MSGFLHHASSMFWAQYPIGTRLDRAFVSHQLNKNRIVVFNGLMLFLSLFTNISSVWTILAVPFLGLTNRDSLRKHTPTDSRVTKYAYLAIAYPFGNLIAVLGLMIAVVLLIIALVVLPVVAVVVLSIWALVVVLLFLSWFTLYRYPVFEVIYPRLRKRILANNSKVYTNLSESPPSIRVIRLRAGSTGDKIECDLVSGPLASLDFEALSYVWGVALLPHTIQVNEKPFYVTYNLHSALTEMRHVKHERLIWIDAVCINQNDNAEKGHQVQMMRDIYAKASRVIVWLGKGTKATSPAFDLVRQFSALDQDTTETFWKDHTKSSHWKRSRREFDRILRNEWWSRAWIIQEVVVGHNVVMQRGPEQIDWEALHKLLTYKPFLEEGFYHLEAPLFAEDIQEIRTEQRANEPISNTLLGLTYRFRFQAATFGSDKIYALLGLLKADNPSLIKPEYDKRPEVVFLQFTISCLEHNKNLTAIVLAAGTELQGVSWCRDWRFTNDGSFETDGLTTHPPANRKYAASGTQPPIYQADISRRLLSLQGYVVDTIDKVGSFHQDIRPSGVDWDLALRGWERVAGGYLDADPESESRQAFNSTITADHWTVEPMDWRERIVRRRPPKNEEDKEYKTTIDRACINRRFFVTKDGKFGLGSWNLKRGDKVCILLGGKTPFILRQCDDRTARREEADAKGDDVKKFYKVVGESFVHGLMYYEGSMEDDLKSGKLVTDWFHLL